MDTSLRLPTDRSFGFTFATVFTVAGGWLLWKSSPLGIPTFGIAAVFGFIAAISPRILHPLNVIWMRFGLLLNRVVSPVALGIIFFAVFTPVAFYFRISGRDALRRIFEHDVDSYWVDRTPPGPEGKTLPRQY